MIDNLIRKSQFFLKSVSNLHVTSKDDSDKKNIVYMTDSMQKAINIDNVKLAYSNQHFPNQNTSYRSVDAIVQTEQTVYFIEFKNGKLCGEERARIREKISNSILLFSDILGITFSNFRNECVFILVYNKEKNSLPQPSQQRIAEFVNKRSENAECRFDFDKLKPFLVHDVKTYTREEFEDFLKKQEFLQY